MPTVRNANAFRLKASWSLTEYHCHVEDVMTNNETLVIIIRLSATRIMTVLIHNIVEHALALSLNFQLFRHESQNIPYSSTLCNVCVT